MKSLIFVVSMAFASAGPAAAWACDSSQLREDRVIISTDDGSIGGSTMRPVVGVSPALALIVAGSGATDRDGRGSGGLAAPYYDLAHALACRGVESFRFDKAGVGESQPSDRLGSHGTLARQVRDLQAVLAELDRRYPGREIVIVAHSEGVLVAAQLPEAVETIFAVSPPGPRIEDSFRYQLMKANLDSETKNLANTYFLWVDVGRLFFPEPSLRGYFAVNFQPYLRELMSVNLSSLLKGRSENIVLVRGQDDTLIPDTEFERLASDLPLSVKVRVPGMDHSFYDDSGKLSELFVDLLINSLQLVD